MSLGIPKSELKLYGSDEPPSFEKVSWDIPSNKKEPCSPHGCTYSRLRSTTVHDTFFYIPIHKL